MEAIGDILIKNQHKAMSIFYFMIVNNYKTNSNDYKNRTKLLMEMVHL